MSDDKLYQHLMDLITNINDKLVRINMKDKDRPKDSEPRCPIIETCKHSIKREEYDNRCIAGCHSWGNCVHLPTDERRRYRAKYFRKPKEWEKQEIAEKL